MKTIYVADDGRQFDDEQECDEYEIDLRTKTSEFKLYNRELKEIRQDGLGFETADYVYIMTPNGLRNYNNRADEYGYEQIEDDKCGMYIFVKEDGMLCHVDDLIHEAYEKLAKFEAVKMMISGEMYERRHDVLHE